MNLSTDPAIQQKIKEEGLVYLTDSSPGIFRQKHGKGFSYYDTKGNKISDDKVIDRIEKLVIPPAWKNVWISPKKNSHLQSTGIDERGRKQYIYHPEWTKVCQEDKFSKMVDFGLSLPTIRSKVKYDLSLPTLEKRKILATVVWLLENTFVHVGNEEYVSENNSFGLTTLRNKHVKVKGQEIIFQFRGKSGVFHSLGITHPTVVKTIKKCIELPGYEVFQYIDEKGDRRCIDSSEVNAFLKEITKDDFSAKDFRTWGATHLSANHFYDIGHHHNDSKLLKKNIVDTVKKVAQHLGNTVSVCRSYYIHPTVFRTYENSILIPHFDRYKKNQNRKSGLSWDETALIKLLQKHS